MGIIYVEIRELSTWILLLSTWIIYVEIRLSLAVLQTVSISATSSWEFCGRVDIVDIVDIRVDTRISKNPVVYLIASDAGNFWEYTEGFGLFLYIHSIIFVVNYKMNIISSHKMFIISPSVTRAAVRGWFWVLGCSSDMSGCIHWDWYWYPGDCLRISATSEAILPWPSVAELRHRPRITDFWGSFCQSNDDPVGTN